MHFFHLIQRDLRESGKPQQRRLDNLIVGREFAI